MAELQRSERKVSSKPQIHRITDAEIKVVDIPGKGKGVVATVDLPPNSRLNYNGKLITNETYEKFADRDLKVPEKGYVNYVMATTLPGRLVDAHPRYQGSSKWYASSVNEPATGEQANMVIKYENRLPVLVSVKEIKAGDELMIKYGSSYVRPYKVGRAAIKPKWLK